MVRNYTGERTEPIEHTDKASAGPGTLDFIGPDYCALERSDRDRFRCSAGSTRRSRNGVMTNID